MFKKYGYLFKELENNSWVLFARFICATVLHLSLIDEVDQTLRRMKFCLNHDYLFQRPYLAFTIGVFQEISTLMVEICNCCIIIQSFDPIDIVLNFIAIGIIVQFDNYVFDAMRNECFKKLVLFNINEKVLVIHHTTSKRCGSQEKSDVKDEDGNLRPLKV